MLIKETKINIADNSGAYLVNCICILKGTKHKKASLGNFIVVSIKKLKKKKKIEKKKTYYALIISIKNKTKRLDGSYINFKNNRALLFNDHLKFIGTRIYGPICKEIRKIAIQSQNKKMLSYAKFII